MAATGFRRVSRKCPCYACGKPDWCSTTATETIPFCARSTLGADRISRNGWGVYYHAGSSSGFAFTRVFQKSAKRKKSPFSIATAPPSILHKVYRKLIELSPAFTSDEIVNGRGGLSERRIFNLLPYGNLPRTVNERRVLTRRIVEAFGKGGSTLSFAGIPGFWRDSKGSLRLWSEQDSFDELMLIRYIPNRSGRYIWLSSLKERNGSGPGAPLHHADPGLWTNRPVLVTEGALKAATAQRFLSNRYVVGNSGVATSHREIVDTARRKVLEIAFDSDSFTNPHVARALASLIKLRFDDQRSIAYDDEVRILSWDRRLKGIDEALLAGVPVSSLTVAEWLKELTPACLEQANLQLSVVPKRQNKRLA
jgi:hypothetical protein